MRKQNSIAALRSVNFVDLKERLPLASVKAQWKYGAFPRGSLWIEAI
jgi:hypothetical protein